MAIYTGRGDSGDTSLIGNIRESKASPVFDVLGMLDEFNATLGLILAEIKFTTEARDFLINTQRDLFKIGSLIANPKSTDQSFEWLEGRTTLIENYIDEMEKKLPELRNFILPGGTEGWAKVHLSRTVCRRLERDLVNYFDKNLMGKQYVIKFVNRLSDLLFTLARYLNFTENVEDIIWIDKNE